MYVLMLTSRTISAFLLSSLLGLVVLCAFWLLGSENGTPVWTKAVFSEQASGAEEEPEAFDLQGAVAEATAVLGGSETLPFLKANRLSFRGLSLSSLPVRLISRNVSFCRALSFFRILPNAP